MAKTTHRSRNDGVLRKASAELFRTPKPTYQALFREYPELVSGSVLDCAAGDGRFILEILKTNLNSHAVYDIRSCELQTWKANGIYRALKKPNCQIVDNWLTQNRPRYFNNIVTNPPFSLACKFVEKGLKWLLPNGHITILHRLNWLGTGARSKWHQTMPLHYIIVIANRPKFELDGRLDNRADVYEYCWFCYKKDYTGQPTVKWIFNK